VRWALFVIVACTLGCRATPVERPHSQSAAIRWANPARTSSPDSIEEAKNSVTQFDSGTDPSYSQGNNGSPLRLNLVDAIRVALAQNPDFRAQRQNERVSVATLEVARTYPFNPQVSADVRPLTREANGKNAAVLVATSVLQEVELGHQGRYREQEGLAELERTQRNLAQAEIATIADTEQRFFAAIYQRRRYELKQSVAELNQEMLGVIERRLEANQASGTDVSLARIELITSVQEAEIARAEYAASLAELRKQLGIQAIEVIEPVGDLETWRWRPAPGRPLGKEDHVSEGGTAPSDLKSEDLEQFVTRRPDVLAAQAELEAARARLQLACAAQTPNVKAGPVYEHDEAGTIFFGIVAEVPLPVINTGESLVRQRRAEFDQKSVNLEQLRVKARLETRAAIERYERARRVVERYGADFGEGLMREAKRVEEQFEAGQADLLRIYSVRKSMIQSRLAYLDSIQELARAAAGITTATGLDPNVLLCTPSPPQNTHQLPCLESPIVE
jgi:cobalt-zinc-cadmium efflux system outer membrane protein